MDKETKKEFQNLTRMVKKGFDSVYTKLGEHNGYFGILESKLAEHDTRFDILEKKIDQTWGLIDSYVKAQEDFREEFKIMKHKMSKIEKVIRAKLGVEI